jgi:hypothetical protein
VTNCCNIDFKKITASTLLVLLLVIHGVKFFHHHPMPLFGHDQVQEQSALLSNSNSQLAQHCAICDFQLAKDADLQIERFSFLPLQIQGEVVCCITDPYQSSYSSVFYLRGPPATV